MGYYDPNRLVLMVLMPLLAANAALWGWYTHNTFMAIVWFAGFIMSAGLYRRNY